MNYAKKCIIAVCLTSTTALSSKLKNSPTGENQLYNDDIKPGLENEDVEIVKLTPGKQFITSEKIVIKFLRVQNDSRCPEDVLCVQAGKAEISVIAHHASLRVRAKEKTMTLRGLTRNFYRESSNSLIVTDSGKKNSWELVFFQLNPYPVSTSRETSSQPIASFAIFKINNHPPN